MNMGIFALFILIVAQSQIIDNLSPQNFTEEVWNSTVKKLNKAHSIRFGAVPLTQEQMKQVLSLPLSNLEQVYFRTTAVKTVIEARKKVSAQTLTPKLLRLLFQGAYFVQLKVLDLSGTNIDDRFVEFLAEGQNSPATLEVLRLQDCLISRGGLALIRKTLKGGTLHELGLRNTLLVEEGSAEVLLSILCESREPNCSSPIRVLDLSNTNIRVRELESFFIALDASAMLSLKLDQVTLVFDHSTAQVDYRALKALAKCPLGQLEELSLRNTFLDDQAARIIGTIPLPNLLQLSVSKNRIGYEGMANLLQFETMPKLQGLHAEENIIEQEIIEIITQSKRPFKKLSATFKQITESMVTFKTNKLQQLRLTTTPDIYKTILTACNLSKLFWLQVTLLNQPLQNNSNSQDSQDQIVIAEQSDSINDFLDEWGIDQEEQDDQDSWGLDDDWFDDDDWLDDQEDDQWQMNDAIPTNTESENEDGKDYNEQFPIHLLGRLKYLKLINFNDIKRWCSKPSEDNFKNTNLSQVSFHTSSSVTLNLKYFSDRYPNLKHFELLLGSQYQTITVDYQSLSEQMYNLHFYLDNIEGRFRGQQIFHVTKYHVKESSYLDQYDYLMWLIFGDDYMPDHSTQDDSSDLFYRYTQVQDLKVKDIGFFDDLSSSGKFTDIHLSLVRKLIIKNIIDVRDALKLIIKVQMPLLESLEISLNTDGSQPSAVSKFIKKLGAFKNLRALHLRFYISESKNKQKYYNSLFEGLFFAKLETIILDYMDLQIQNIADFIAVHNLTLRSIDLSYNYIERDFFSLLRRANITLSALKLDYSYISLKDFSELAQVNTHFMETLSMPTSDLTDLHFTRMMTLKQREFSSKMRYIDIYDNDVRNEALTALFRGGMDHLQFCKVERSRQLLNLLLKYPHKLNSIYSEEIYGMSLDVVSNISSIQMKELTIKSIQSEEDLLRLGKLAFPSLDSFAISIHNIYNCAVLEAILNISRSAKESVRISIFNSEVGLNSKCLSAYSDLRVSTEQFQINDQYSTTSLEEFAKIFITPKLISLQLIHTRLSDIAIRSILKQNYSLLSYIDITLNYLGEALVSHITFKNFPQLGYIDLSFNNLTQTSTKSINYLLSYCILELEGNNFGPDFCKNLIVEDIFLKVKRSGLTKECLDNLLENENVSSLNGIDLSYNDINQFELLEFAEKAKLVFKKLRQIDAYGIAISIETYKKLQKTSIFTVSNYDFDELQFKNSAKY